MPDLQDSPLPFNDGTLYDPTQGPHVSPTQPIIPTVGVNTGKENTNSVFSNFLALTTPINNPAPENIGSKEYYHPETIPTRYPIYHPGIDNEDLYGQLQPWYKQVANGFIKGGVMAISTIADSLMTAPDTLNSISTGKFSGAYQSPLENSMDKWVKTVTDDVPNYYTKDESANPFALRNNLFNANFWGDKLISNFGFTVGAIGGAVLQDAVVSAITGGIGEMPLVSSQLGKLSLFFSKFASGTSRAEQFIQDIKSLGLVAEKEKSLINLATSRIGKSVGNGLLNSAQFATTLWTSARTEGGIEGRDGYNTVKADLLQTYKDSHLGQSPEGKDLQDIESNATASANVRFGVNLVILGLSDAIQWDGILKSFNFAKSGEKASILSTLEERLGSQKIGLKEGSLDEFEVKSPKGIGAKVWNVVRPSLPSIVSEGIYEEGGQYAAQIGTQNYYERKYKNEHGIEQSDKVPYSSDTVQNILYSTGQGLSAQFGTTEGLENMFLGAISGFLQSGGKRLLNSFKNNTVKQQEVQTIVNTLNGQSLTGSVLDHIKNAVRTTEDSQDIKRSVENNDMFDYQNGKHNLFFNYVMSRLQSNRYELVPQILNMLKEMPQAEFERTFGTGINDHRDLVNNHVDELIKKAEDIKDSYDTISKIFDNPFQKISSKDKELTPQSLVQGALYNKFEDYKTTLTHLASYQGDSNNRIADIQREISKINPLIDTTHLATISSTEGLKGLSQEYTQKAKDIFASVEGMTKKDSKVLRNQAQLYTSLAAKIENQLNQPKIDEKLFGQLIDFHSSGETSLDTPQFAHNKVFDLANYGADLNKLNQRKEYAGKAYESLFSEKGFSDFLDKEDQPLFTEVKVSPPVDPQELEKAKNNAVQTILSKKENEEFASLVPENTTAQEKIDFLHSLQDKDLSKSLKKEVVKATQEIEDRLAREKEELEKVRKNEELNKTLTASLTTSGENTVNQTIPFEGSRKAVNILFASTRAFSPQYTGEEAQPHHQRANYFGAIFPTLANQEDYHMMVLTPNSGDIYQPIIDLQKGTYKPTSQDDEIILQVAIKKTTGGYVYVNEKGEELSPITETIDPNLTVFQVMPRASLKWSSGEEATRSNEEKEVAKLNLDKYKEVRSKYLAQTSPQTFYKFTPSFGIVKEQFKTDEPQPVTNIVTKKQIDTTPLIVLSTQSDETVSNGFQTLKVPLGRPVLVTNNSITPLNNRLLTTSEQDTIYKSLLALTKLPSLNENPTASKIFDYLRGIVYWGIPKNEAGHNSIWFANGMLNFGKDGNSVPFTTESLTSNKDQVITYLKDIYNNVNVDNLKSSEPYYEITDIAEDGTPIQNRWATYQNYLLNPREDTPLSTNIPPILTKTGEQTREGIYFVLEALEQEYEKSGKKPIEQKVEKKVSKRISFLTELSGIKEQTPTIKDESLSYEEKKNDIESRRKEELHRESKLAYEGKNPKYNNDWIKAEEEVNKKYNAELEQLKNETTQDKETIVEPGLSDIAKILMEQGYDPNRVSGIASKITDKIEPRNTNRETRIVTDTQVKPEDWKKVETFLAKNVPGLPLTRVKNLIQVTQNTQAWGLFADGAIYLYENAEEGTFYHEVFHGVMQHFSPDAEKTDIYNEFKDRKGSFIERGTGQEIKYTDATYKQSEEKLAEEFRNYVLGRENKSFIGKVGQFFKDLVSFIRGLFRNKLNIQELFRDINGGQYRYYTTGLDSLSYTNKGIMNVDYISTDSFSNIDLREKLNAVEEKDILDHMTSQTFDYLSSEAKDLFSLQKINKTELYSKIQEYTLASLISGPFSKIKQELEQDKITQDQYNIEEAKLDGLATKLITNWDDLEKRHVLHMKNYGYQFDENDDILKADENRTGRETGQDAMGIDHIRKANNAIKLFVATIRKTVFGTPKFDDVLQATELANSSIGGDLLASYGKSMVQLLNNLSSSPTFDVMMDNLINLAKESPDYVRAFTRLKGQRVSGKIDWENMSLPELQLLMAFFRTFSKDAPIVMNQFIGEDGTVYTGSGNIATATQQIKETFEQSLISTIKKNGTLFKKDSKKGWSVNQAELKTYSLHSDNGKLAFLKALGIEIKFNLLPISSKNIIRSAIQGIYTSLKKGGVIATLNGRTLGLSNRLSQIAETQAKLNMEGFDSSFFGVNKEMRQTFNEKNYFSHFAEILNNIKNRKELDGTSFGYLNSDVFSRNSLVLQNMFDEDGNRNFSLSTGYYDGTVDEKSGKNTPTDLLPKGKRLLQQINAQLSGHYYALVPADASTERYINFGALTNFVDPLTFAKYTDIVNNQNTGVYSIFKGYLEDEVSLAQEKRTTSLALQKGGRNTELRFFKDILGDKLAKEAAESMDFKAFYDKNEEDIQKKIDGFITDLAHNIKVSLLSYKLIETNDKEFYTFPSLDTTHLDFNKDSFTEDSLNSLTKFIASNYAIGNIEIFKLIAGDPYQFNDDILKRTKHFGSPAETTIHSSPEFNAKINEFYNKGLISTDPGYMEVKEYVNTAVLKDIITSTALYNSFVEADAQGLITDDADRQFKIKSGLWLPDSPYEAQYQYDKAWERNQKAGLNDEYLYKGEKYAYSSKELETSDKNILDEGNPRATKDFITKPIVKGNKYDSKINDIAIDKDSLAPISYRAQMEFNQNSNMISLYNKMKKENIDYVIFESGRKVGTTFKNKVYNEEGGINSDPFEGVTKIGFENFSIQQNTQPKQNKLQTLGSQLSRMATIDMFSNGIPSDYKGEDWYSEKDKEKTSPVYKEAIHNQTVLKELMKDGYETFLKKLGITHDGTTFSIDSKEKAATTLKNEILNREVNDNIIKALDFFANGEIALEATPVYQQFKNIIMSLVDKNIVSLKVNGGAKTQMASTFLEEKRIVKSNIDGKTIYHSDILKEYEDEDGKRYCEIFLSSDFIRKRLSKELNQLSDKELLEKLKDSDILQGIGFRIPFQNSNSVEVFRIKAFLPIEMGDTVVVPSSLVAKTGSDFDIDKLNTYLKNIYTTSKGEIKAIPFFGFGEKAKIEINKWLVLNELQDLTSNKANENAIDELSEEDNEKDTNEIDKIYKASLQNEYYNSLQRLIEHPDNFKKLVSPNDASSLKTIAEKIAGLKGIQGDNAPLSSLLSLTYMNNMRHDFVIGKGITGIGATAQTGLALRQASQEPIYIDTDRLSKMSPKMREWIGNGQILLPHNNIIVNGRSYTSMSSNKSVNGDYISDTNSMVIDGSVDIAKGAWIMQLLNSPKTAPTFLTLAAVGVPKDTAAYFINQPIVTDYLAKLDQAGYSWLFIKNFVDELKTGKYKTSYAIPARLYNPQSESRLNTYLADNISKNAANTQFTQQDNAYQHLVIDEFLKYAQIAQHSFYVTQGTNWDVANFNDPYLLYQKEVQLERANESIISSADKILNNSFVGETKDLLQLASNSLFSILPTESPRVRTIIKSTLENYTDLPSKQFVLMAKKAVQSFLDYTLQTYYRLNSRIDELMIGDQNTPNKLRVIIDDLKQNNPDSELLNNPVISSILTLEAQKEGKTNNLKLRTKNAEIYQQNALTKAFQELKENPLTKEIYPDIIRVSLLQGLANSPISFTQFIPVEDLVNSLQPIIDQLDSIPDLEAFSQLHMFERNNWNNTDIVPYQKQWQKTNGVLKIYSKVGKGLQNIREQGGDVIALDALTRTSNSDIVTITYNKPEFSPKDIENMKKVGDFSYLYKGLFQKVYNNGKEFSKSYTVPGVDGAPDRVGRTIYFKAINALGDSYKLQEYYNHPQQSIVDNGYEKINTELTDDVVIKEVLRPTPKSNFIQDITPEEGTEGIC